MCYHCTTPIGIANIARQVGIRHIVDVVGGCALLGICYALAFHFGAFDYVALRGFGSGLLHHLSVNRWR